MKKRLVALLILALVTVLALASCGDPIGDWLNQFLDTPPVEEIKEEYAVYFLAGEGIGVPSQTVEEGSLVTKPEDPYMEGFLFDGWYKDAEFTEAWNFDTDTVTKNTIIYGKWVDHTHSGGTATCTEKAICEVCDHAYGSLLDHVGGTATCTAQAECEVCGTPYGQPLGHDVVVIEGKAPTCTETGLTDGAYCTRCDAKVEQEVIDALGHTPVVDEAVAPTCTETGLTEGSHCSTCETVLEAQEVIPATGHTWGEWIVDVEPTENAEGSKHRECACGERETVAIPALNHTHSYTSEVTTKAGCETDGVRTFTCSCGDSYTEAIPATGHTEGEVVVENEVAATCTAEGSHDNVVYCVECDAELSRETVTTDALGHKDENGDFKCDNDCGKVVEPADGTVLTFEQAKALANLFAHDTYTTNKYYVTGIISEVYNTQYGNIKLEGTDFVIYGLYSADGKTRYDAMTYKPVKGDEITVYGVVGKYNTTLQMKNGWLDEVVAHEHDYSEATCKVLATCSICGGTTGELAEHVYVDGICSVCGHDKDAVVTDITFELGANGKAEHSDGTDTTEDKTYTETVNGYTLTITSTAKMYNGGRDAKGNSCLKFGTSSKTGNMSFTVPDDVVKVVIYVSGYKATTTTNIKVNGTAYTVKTASNNGEYTAIEIDTTTTKTVTFETVTYRAMVNSIVFVLGATEPECEHEGGKATCKELAVCDKCGESYGELGGHTEVVDSPVTPTCEETGLTEGKHCSVCNEVLVAQQTVDALGHNGGEAVVEKDVKPTCTTAGSYDTVVYCTVCEKELSRKTTTVNALGHAWGEWIEDAPATEETDGAKHRVCGTCGEVEEGVIPSIEHVHSYTPTVTDPTCTEQGYTTHTCRCGDTKVDTYVDALGHTEGEEVVENKVDATCTEDGSYDAVVYCSVCETELSRVTRTIDATGHDYDETVTDPTCEAKGYTTYTCECGHSYTDNEVAALGHDWNDGEVTKAATYGHAGTMKYTCTRDNTHTKTETIAKLVLAADATPAEIVNAAYSLANGESLSNKQTLTGVIVQVDTAYDSGYKNVTVTIKVNGADETKLIMCYRMKGTGADTIGAGDTITVSGTIKNYNGTIEFDSGCTLDSYTVHEHTFTDATCETKATCSLCGITEGELADHVYENGVCKVCGLTQGVETTTVTYTASTQGYTNAQDVKSITLDANASVAIVSGGGQNSTKYYSSGSALRVYPKNTFTFSVAEGCTIVSIKITSPSSYTISSSKAVLTNATGEYNGTVVTLTPVDGSKDVSFQFAPTATSGQCRISSIEITYSYAASEPAHECEHACDECGKCTDADCNETVCAEKCEGHHECEHVCPECGKCTDTECTEDVCAEKCEGHKNPISTTTTINLSNVGVHFEGNTGTYGELEIDATNGKFKDNGNWTQVNAGTVITLYVLDDAQVSVTAYYSASNFTITVVDGVCTITATGNDYLKAITVKYAIVYNEETTIDLSKTGVHFEGNTGVYEGLEIDATNGKFADNNGGWVQVNAGTVITFNVFEGANVSVKSYSNNPDNFTITVVDGVCTITVVGNDYINTITIAEKCNCADVDPRDHKCDACGETLSECADVNPVDHECDTCGKALSECKDTNSNHKCDICGDKMSDCADVDPRDHECDVCGLALTRCEDGEIKNHVCEICGDEVSKCRDDNKDHNCDVCGAVLSECDTDYRTHNCEYCGKKLTECLDLDSDHECDICGLSISECKDADNNHKCDICGDTMSKCADVDPRDHECDVCGLALTKCEDGEIKDHVCDICGDEVSKCKDDNKDHNCDVCGAVLSKCDTDYRTHNCEYCGKKLTDCVDNDNDHECDVCGLAISECKDANNNHKCDVCGDTMSKCADEDQNHYCDICGIQNSQCMDLPPYDHKCDWCGEKVSEHEEGTVVVENNVPADCENAGSYDNVVYCTVCGAELSRKTVPVSATGHSWGEWIEDTPAGEYEDGTKHRECDNCDATENGIIPALGHEHSYNATVTDPTCTEKGYTTHTCRCNDSYVDTYVDALGHNTVVDKAVAPTCTEDGLTEGSHCTRCDYKVTQDVVPATGHATEVEYWTYNNELYLVPVCGCLTEKVLVDTTKGVGVSNEADLVFLLTNGFDVKLEADIDLTETIDIMGSTATIDLNGKTLKADWESDGVVEVLHIHDGSNITIIGEGNVVSGGTYTAGTNSVISCRIYSELTIKGGNYYSASYGDVIFCETSSIVRIEGGHFEAAESYYGTWYVLDIDEEETNNRGQFVVTGGTFVNFDPANHTNDRDYTNKVADGYHSIGNDGVYTVSAHDYEYSIIQTAPTCTEDGYTTYTCICGDSYVDDEYETPGHNYKPSVTDPTCTTDGYTTYKCSVCGDTYVDNKVASKGHVKGDAVIEKEVKPTCETKGSYETAVYCTVCDAELDRTTAIVSALGHDYKAVVTKPDCVNGGYTTYTCSVCGDDYKADEVAATGHTEVTVSGKDATCTEDGLTEGKKCSVCGEVTVAQDKIDATGHDEYDLEEKAATCEEDGSEGGTGCRTCGEILVAATVIPAGHNYVNGVCTKCNLRKTTANVSIQNYAAANGWTNETKHAEVEIDHNVIASLSGTDTYTSNYYTTDHSWRMYQTGTAKLTITASNNATIVSVKITYIIEKTGILTLNGKNITSGTVVEVNDSEIVFGVGNTGTATNGQVRITGIEVVYTGGAAPCEHTDVTEIEAKAATCTTDGYKAHYQCNDCEVYYADEDCTKKIANVDVWKANDGKVPMTGHDYVDGKCHCGEEDPNYGEELTEITETISFASTAQRTSLTTAAQVWKNGGVTFTNNKASSSSSVANYSKPVRLYAGSNIVVAATGKITKIVFDCNSNSYATTLKTSMGSVSGATVTVNNDKVTVTFSNPVDSFTIAKLSAQVRLDSMTVTYLG